MQMDNLLNFPVEIHNDYQLVVNFANPCQLYLFIAVFVQVCAG
jgi:hypothetical protein